MEMALKSYRSTIEVHREGKAYKDMMSKMYYVDGDLKNDTVQFDLAVERFKINNGYIDKRIKDLMEFETNSLYDIENFCVDNESNLPFKSRKTKSDGREKRKAIFEAKTKCAQKSRLLPPSGQNTSVVQTPFESCLNDAFLLNFLLKYHLKTIANLAKNRIFT